MVLDWRVQKVLALAHFNPKKELIVALDTSDYGIGAVLLHRLLTIPITPAFRTLLPAERNYSQIEKESLSIIYAIVDSYMVRHLHYKQTPNLYLFLAQRKGYWHTPWTGYNSGVLYF